MSQLKKEVLSIPSADFGGESTLPHIATKLSLGDIENRFLLDEDDGLYINYGVMECGFPYKIQDMYDRGTDIRDYDTYVLENDYIKAVFMPDFGGKLWSLYDKVEKRELLFSNKVVRPCNLAVRNAWLSGGIEWNCGFKGHGPFTCSRINTAITKLDDGTPVLRFYYFERIRCVVVQMDFFLPDDAKYLCCRMRITNPGDEVVPIYWWSNVAAEEKDGDRVIVPADESYTAPYGYVEKINIPVWKNTDVSYPTSNLASNDFFWKTRDDKRRYIYQADKDGYGLFQTSTDRLKGRKLFIWGNSQGGHKWMNFLTADNESGRYDEIQCGLARTQYECLPMPPHTVWEWMEVYGPLAADAAKVHGEWSSAQAEAEERMDDIISAEKLENMLADTRAMAKRPAEQMIYSVDGWGALEAYTNESGNIPLCEHLDFGAMGDEQKDWIRLMEQGTLGEHNPEAVPVSYIRQPMWTKLLEKAIENKDAENWYTYYQLGCIYSAEERYEDAKKMLAKSLSLCNSPWSNYAMAVACEKTGELAYAVSYVKKAYLLKTGELSLAKELYRFLHKTEMYDDIIAMFESDSEIVKNNNRCKLYYAVALAYTGRLDESESIIINDGKYLIVPDIRECETTITDLWFYINEHKYNGEGEPPRDLDFRMFVNRD